MNLLWVDANGLVLGTAALLDYASTGGGLLLDSNGWLWRVDTNTAGVGSMAAVGRHYVTPGCVGAAYVSEGSYVRPRWTISVVGLGEFFARGDQQQLELIHATSYFDGLVCSSRIEDVRAFRLDGMSTVTHLTINPVGPVHVERR
jgi:hypothetical protein